MTKLAGEKTLLQLDGLYELQYPQAEMVLAQLNARDPDLSLEEAVAQFEAAYVKTAQSHYGREYKFWARLKRDGRIDLVQVLKIVKVVKNAHRHVSLENVQQHDPKAKIGQFVVNALPPIHPQEFADNLGKAATFVQDVRISTV